jgi:hypothetical protein
MVSASAVLQLVIFGPPMDAKDLIIWLAEKLASALVSAVGNLIQAEKLANEMNNAPSAIVFNNTPYCFYSSASSSNQGNAVWYQYNNGSEWVQSELSFSIYCQGGPSAAVFNNQIYVFFEQAQPNTSAGIGYVVSSDGSTWSAAFNSAVTTATATANAGDNESSTGVATNSGPSAVAFNGVLYLFYTGTGNTQLCLTTSSDGSSWSNFGLVPSTGTAPGGSGSNYMGITGSPSAVVYTNSSGQAEIYVFHQGGNSNGELWYNVMNASGSWQGDTQIALNIYGTSLSLSAAPSAFVFDNLIYVIFDSGGQLLYVTSADGSTYSGAVPFGLIASSNTLTNYAMVAPSVVPFNGQLVCAAPSPGATEASGGPIGYAVTSPGGNWAFMSPIMPAQQEANKGYLYANWQSSGNLIVFNNQLYCFVQTPSLGSIAYSVFNGESWTAEAVIAPDTTYMSCSPVPVILNGILYLFFQKENDGSWTYYIYSTDGSNWSAPINVSNTNLSFSPSPVAFGGQIYLIHQGSSDKGQIWFNVTTGGSGSSLTWCGDAEIGGLNVGEVQFSQYNGNVPPAAIVFNGELYVFYITSDVDLNWAITYFKYTGSPGSTSNSWSTGSPIAIRNDTNFSGGNTGTGLAQYYTTGNFSLTTYNNANGTPTLAVYFVGYGTNNIYYVETTDPSSSGNWSQPVQAGVAGPQGSSFPVGATETAVSWAVACLTGTPGEWYSKI